MHVSVLLIFPSSSVGGLLDAHGLSPFLHACQPSPTSSRARSATPRLRISLRSSLGMHNAKISFVLLPSTIWRISAMRTSFQESCAHAALSCLRATSAYANLLAHHRLHGIRDRISFF